MKKLILILVSIAVLTGVVSAIVVAALPDSTAANELASNYKSHGQLGNGNVNQEFKGGFIDPWDCPPKNGQICWP